MTKLAAALISFAVLGSLTLLLVADMGLAQPTGDMIMVSVQLDMVGSDGEGTLTYQLSGKAAGDLRRLVLDKYDGLVSGTSNGLIDAEELSHNGQAGYVPDLVKELESMPFKNIRSFSWATGSGDITLDVEGFVNVHDIATNNHTPASIHLRFNASKVPGFEGDGRLVEALNAPLFTVGQEEIGSAWEQHVPLPTAGAGYAQAYEGEIYFISGECVQRFDPTAGVWMKIKDEGIGYQPYRGGSALIGDRIYIVNGWVKALYYDITMNSFVDIPNPSIDRLDVAVGTVDGKVYVSGGWYSGDPTSVNVVEAYDPSSGSWSQVSSMLMGRKDHEMIGVGDYLYAVSGLTGPNWYGYSTSVERYDPELDAWSFVSSCGSSYREHGLIEDGENILVVSPVCEVYDIANDSWSSAPPIYAQGDGFGYFANAAVYLNGYAYSIGGRTAPDNWYDDVFRLRFGSTVEHHALDHPAQYDYDYATWQNLSVSGLAFPVVNGETILFEHLNITHETAFSILAGNGVTISSETLGNHTLPLAQSLVLDTDDNDVDDLSLTVLAVYGGNLTTIVSVTPLPNMVDDDQDDDGVPDDQDAFPEDPNESVDLDNDGIGDNADPDDDNDGTSDDIDLDPLDPSVTTGEGFDESWLILGLIIFFAVVAVFLVGMKMNSESVQYPETDQEPERETYFCQRCGSQVRVGSPCHICSQFEEGSIPEPEAPPEAVKLSNEEIVERLRKAYEEGHLTEEQYRMNLEKFQ